MKTLLSPLIVLVLYACIRSIDLAISAGLAKNTVRCVCYCLVALLALIALVIALVVS